MNSLAPELRDLITKLSQVIDETNEEMNRIPYDVAKHSPLADRYDSLIRFRTYCTLMLEKETKE